MNEIYQRLSEDHELLPFDCGDQDLNEFLEKDAMDYQRGLFAVTYYVEGFDETIIYFSLSNDKLSAIEMSKADWRRIKRSVPREKHRKDYPAVKIGRFAVGLNFQKSEEHWGTVTMDYIKEWMISDNKTGCRFITVDAYKKAVPFYLHNEFVFIGHEEEDRYNAEKDDPECKGTYAMYFDLSKMLKQDLKIEE